MYYNTRENITNTSKIVTVKDDDLVIYLTFSEAWTIFKSKENEDNSHKYGISKVDLKIDLICKLFNIYWQQWSQAKQSIMQVYKIWVLITDLETVAKQVFLVIRTS